MTLPDMSIETTLPRTVARISMIHPGGTLTIKRSVEVFPDLWQQSSWPLFSRAPAPIQGDARPNVGAVTLTWSDAAASYASTCATAADETRRWIERAIVSPPAGLWLFLAQTPWQPRSAIVRHKRLWKGLAGNFELSRIEPRDEVCIESEEGIRFAGIGYVTPAGLADAISISRLFDFACPLLAPIADDFPLSADELFAAAFPSAPGKRASTSVDWPSFVSSACRNECIVVRETREAAEGAVAVDFFVDGRSLLVLHRLAPDNR
jgi:hypothetical protein